MSSARDSSFTVPKRPMPTSLRRQNKPLIEKRRRARINECLLQLKKLLGKDGAKESQRAGSKLEKADILEMTVHFVRKMADKQPHAEKNCSSWTCTTDNMGASFQDGFNRCMEEVDFFFRNQPNVEPAVHHKLLSHCRQQLRTKDGSQRAAPSSRHLALQQDMQTVPIDPASCHEHTQRSHEDIEMVEGLYPAGDDTNCKKATSSDLHVSFTPISEVQGKNSSSMSSRGAEGLENRTFVNNRETNCAAPLKVICGGNVFVLVDQQNDSKDREQDLFPVVTTNHLICVPILPSRNASATCTHQTLPQVNTRETTVPDSASPEVTSGTECMTSQGDRVTYGPHQWKWCSYKGEKLSRPSSLLSDSQNPTAQLRRSQNAKVADIPRSQNVPGNKQESEIQPNCRQNKMQNTLCPLTALSDKQEKGTQCYNHPVKEHTDISQNYLLFGDEQGSNTLYPCSLAHKKQDTDIQAVTLKINSPLQWLADDNKEIQCNYAQLEQIRSTLHPYHLQSDMHPTGTRNYNGQAERVPGVCGAHSSLTTPIQSTVSAPESPQSLPVPHHVSRDVNNNQVTFPSQASVLWRPW